MEFIESIKSRYTTKVYDPTKSIDADKLEQLKSILNLSPSSINSQPWMFAFVVDGKVKGELAEASFFNAEKVTNSAATVVFMACDDVDVFESWAADNLAQGANDYYRNFIKSQSEQGVKSWFAKQVYLALGVFLSACANMGIDSTPMEGIDCAKYDAIIGEQGYKTLFAVALGCRDAEDFNQIDRSPKSRKSIDQVIKTI